MHIRDIQSFLHLYYSFLYDSFGLVLFRAHMAGWLADCAVHRSACITVMVAKERLFACVE